MMHCSMYSDYVSTALIQARFHAVNRSLDLLGLHLRSGFPPLRAHRANPNIKTIRRLGGKKNFGPRDFLAVSDSLVKYWSSACSLFEASVLPNWIWSSPNYFDTEIACWF